MSCCWRLQISGAIREVCRSIKAGAPASMPAIYLRALKASYDAVDEAGGSESAQQAALQDFSGLAHKIAGMYAGGDHDITDTYVGHGMDEQANVGTP